MCFLEFDNSRSGKQDFLSATQRANEVKHLSQFLKVQGNIKADANCTRVEITQSILSNVTLAKICKVETTIYQYKW